MHTPVSTARQCLTADAAHALDEAVNVAKRRGHGQTTSLHAFSALLSLPSSPLRDACSRARGAYPVRLQLKALELCLGVSLDRVPSSSQPGSDPPVSNSLMAAIKRSQANQRRQPESFHVYQLTQLSSPSGGSPPCVKVELRNFILSILDDPVVSRVFGEAGFRSPEVKLALLRPAAPQILRLKGPTMFLCSWRGIGEVFGREKGRNPVLVGACAFCVLDGLSEVVEKRKDRGFSPLELSGLRVIELGRVLGRRGEKGYLDLKFQEVGSLVNDQSWSLGVVLNLGDLKVLVDDEDEEESLGDLVGELSKLLLRVQERKRVWVIGALERYETYRKLVAKFPCIEKDWGLQLLPITTSFRTTPTSGSYPRSSLMESFVPFGGFFSTPSDFYGPLSISSQRHPSRCNICNEKCEQEIDAVSKKGLTTGSVADQYQSCLPPWLQMAELGTNKVLNGKARDNGVLLSAEVGGVQKKWDNICHLHHTKPTASNCCPPHFPTFVGFQMVEHGVSSSSNVPPAASRWANSELPVPTDSLHISRMHSEVRADNIQFKKREASSKKEDAGSCGRVSLSQTTSMTTDLGLRMKYAGNNVELKTPARPNQNQRELLSLSSHGSPDVDYVSGIVSDHLAQSSSSSSTDFDRQFDPNEYKMLFKELIERVGWQTEAVHDICQIVARYWTKNEKHEPASLRKGIWFHFLGPDRYGKRRVAAALAERCGSEENILFTDYGPRDHRTSVPLPLDSLEMSGYDVTSRGKTLVDHIAGELRKKPSLVVFLENVERADVVTQNILSRAVRSGKFSDSNGREVGVGNAVFMTTSTFSDDEIRSSRKDYSETRVLRAKGWPLQIIVEQAVGNSSSIFPNKRKFRCTNENHDQPETVKRVHTLPTRNLDLNLDPVEEKPTEGSEDVSCDSDFASDSSRTWLQEHLELVDRTISFKPFDFDTLATRLSDEIDEAFHKIAGREPLFEIDPKVMEQLLVAAYLSETKRAVEDWVEQVLSWGFVQAAKRYNLGSHSVVRLVAREDRHAEETKPVVFLPRKIILN